MSIKEEQYVEITLTPPTHIKRIIIQSGSPLYPLDSFLDSKLSIGCTDLKRDVVAEFVDSPLLDITLNATEPVACFRVTITKPRKNKIGKNM